MDIFNVISILGGLAMFLYGMQYYEFLIRIGKEILTSNGNISYPRHTQLILKTLTTAN